MKASRIKELREKAGLTQKQVADALGIAQPTYARLETGSRYDTDKATIDPRLSTLERLCGVLKCSITDIIGPKRGRK